MLAILFAVAGFFLYGPVGAVVGLIVGLLVGTGIEPRASVPEQAVNIAANPWGCLLIPVLLILIMTALSAVVSGLGGPDTFQPVPGVDLYIRWR